MIWVTRSIHYLSYITKYGLGLNEFFRIILFILPGLLVLTIPICTFTSAILYYNKISRNNELIILRNSGLKKKDLLVSASLIGLISCFILYFIMFYLLPRGNILFDRFYDSMRHNIVKFLLNSDDFRTFENMTLHSKGHDDNKLNSLIIYINDKKDGNKAKVIYAKNAEIIGDKYLKFYNGNIHFIKLDNKQETNILFFKDYIVDINEFLPVEKQKKYDDTEFLNIRDILKMKHKTNNLIAEIIYRIINPLFSIILTLLSSLLVLKISFTRSENNMKNIIIFIINLLLFGIFSYSFKLSKKSNLAIYMMLLTISIPTIYLIISILKDD